MWVVAAQSWTQRFGAECVGTMAHSETHPWHAQRSRRTFLALAMVPALALWIGCSDPATRVSEDELQIFDLVIEKRHVAIADEVIRVREGQRVELRWLSDEQATVHLHGYDIHASLKPNTQVVWNFEASATGRFPIEAHDFGGSDESVPLDDHSHQHDPSHEHGHSDHHDRPAHEAASDAGPAERTLLYFEVHPR